MVGRTKRNSLFGPSKNKRLARLVDITSPTAFRKGLREAKKRGFTLKEKRAFVLGKNRAGAQLERKNLSIKERRQFGAITKIRIPNVNTRRSK